MSDIVIDANKITVGAISDVFPTFATTASAISIGTISNFTNSAISLQPLKTSNLFRCPYCDALSFEPGVCKNCGGVKEIWY